MHLLKRFIYILGSRVTIADVSLEIGGTQNSSTQVVTTIDMVADIGEAVHTDIGLGVSVDIGITATCKGVEDTSVIQVNGRVTTNRSQEATAIDKLSLSHKRIVVFATLGTCYRWVVQVDSSAIFSVSLAVVTGVLQLTCRAIAYTLTDSTFLTTTEYLEGIASIQVDGGRTPNLGILTITTAKHVERLTQHIHTLLVKNDTRVTLCDDKTLVAIKHSLTGLVVRLYLIENIVNTCTVDKR